MESNNNVVGFDIGKDRRRFLRLSLEPPLQVKFKHVLFNLPSKSAQENEALIKNISVGGGLLIELVLKSEEERDKPLAGEEKILFEAGLLETHPQIKILGRVAWIKKMDKPGSFYEAGVSFENIDEKIQENILHAMIDLAFKQRSLKT